MLYLGKGALPVLGTAEHIPTPQFYIREQSERCFADLLQSSLFKIKITATKHYIDVEGAAACNSTITLEVLCHLLLLLALVYLWHHISSALVHCA